MANVTAPRGLTPVRHLDGSNWNQGTEMFYIPASDATAVFVGDVVLTGGISGTVGVSVNGINVEGMPTVTKTGIANPQITGQNVAGVVVGFSVDQPSYGLNLYRAASTARIAFVVTDYTVVYEIQEDTAVSVLAAADIGLNIGINTVAGSTTTGRSLGTLNNNSKATTVTLPFKILRLVNRPDNAFNTGGLGTDQAKFEVMLNTQQFAPNVAGF